MKNSILINKRGFSLIELIISIGILSIITISIFSFFIFNYKNYIDTDDSMEIQHQLQTAMNGIIDNLIFAKGVYNHDNNPIYIAGESSSSKIKKIVFEREKNDEIEYFILEFKPSHELKGKDNKLLYTVTRSNNPLEKDGETEIASYIDYIKIKPIDMSNCVEIEMKATKGDTSVVLENKVFLRNTK